MTTEAFAGSIHEVQVSNVGHVA
eukprot:COSAG01_NODE_7332_length_3247_cov_2.094663_8_plen_22_part_01